MSVLSTSIGSTGSPATTNPTTKNWAEVSKGMSPIPEKTMKDEIQILQETIKALKTALHSASSQFEQQKEQQNQPPENQQEMWNMFCEFVKYQKHSQQNTQPSIQPEPIHPKPMKEDPPKCIIRLEVNNQKCPLEKQIQKAGSRVQEIFKPKGKSRPCNPALYYGFCGSLCFKHQQFPLQSHPQLSIQQLTPQLVRDATICNKLLWSSRGKLEIPKCVVYHILPIFNQYDHSYLDLTRNEQQVKLVTTDSQSQVVLPAEPVYQAHRTLGLHVTPTGNKKRW